MYSPHVLEDSGYDLNPMWGKCEHFSVDSLSHPPSPKPPEKDLLVKFTWDGMCLHELMFIYDFVIHDMEYLDAK